MRVDRIAQRDVGVDLHAFLRVEAHLLVVGAALAKIVGPLDGLHERRELDDLTPQRTVEDPAGPDRNLGWTALRAAQHNLDADVSGADASDRRDVVEEDHSSDNQADSGRAKFEELRRSAKIIVPAIAGAHYFTKERHYILQIFLNATKPPAAVASNRHTPPRTARSLGKLSRWNAVTMTQYKGSVTHREPSSFQNNIQVPGQFLLGPTTSTASRIVSLNS